MTSKKLKDQNVQDWQNWQSNSDWQMTHSVQIFVFKVKKYKFRWVKTQQEFWKA